MDIHQRTAFVKSTAQKLKFDFCGISKAEYLAEDADRLKNWLNNNYHGLMAYMANHFDKRVDPSELVENARSVISLLYNYYPKKSIQEKDNFKIARYAYGKDYHFIIKDRLKEFLHVLKKEIPGAEGRVFVDSAPVLERQWAARSGLGWIGKNTMLINKKAGSYLFIADIITTMEFVYDNPIGDFCGTCTRCVEACPTNALKPYEMDASKCISYLTIELKEDIPEYFKGKLNDWIFGCDICQEACPWNRFSKPHNEPQFLPAEELYSMNKNKWRELNEARFQLFFRKSAVKRTKFYGLKRNINFANK
jgi:epoxyqueuosine reductase